MSIAEGITRRQRKPGTRNIWNSGKNKKNGMLKEKSTGITYRFYRPARIKICLCDTWKPVWGNLDILKACGALDSGSNPGAGYPFF